MELSIRKLGHGKQRVFFSGALKETAPLEKMLNNENVTLYFIEKNYHDYIMKNIPRKLTIYGDRTTPELLKKEESREWYKKFTSELLIFLKKEKIKHAFFEYYLLSFSKIAEFQQNGIELTTLFADDPEDTYFITKKYGPKYDRVITLGVQYNKELTMEQKFKEFKIKNVKFLPIIVDPDHYDGKIPFFRKRDLDIVYVGALAWKKWVRIHRIYSAFKNKFVIYSKYDPREMRGIVGMAYRVLNFFYPLPKTVFASDREVKDIYARAKIGYNCHTSYGPSNSRMYELGLTGVFQVTDNPKGTRKVYDVGKELVCYETTVEAIELIKKYLSDKKARERIAMNGFKRSIKDYTYEEGMRRHIRFTLGKKV